MRKVFRFSFFLIIMAAVTGGSTACNAEDVADFDVLKHPHDFETLAFLSTDGPRLIRISMVIDNETVAEKRRKYVANIFAEINENGNRFIDPEEIERLYEQPPFQSTGLTLDEFKEFLKECQHHPLRVVEADILNCLNTLYDRSETGTLSRFEESTANTDGPSWRTFDFDFNGQLEPAELRRTFQQYRRYDIDENGIFDRGELAFAAEIAAEQPSASLQNLFVTVPHTLAELEKFAARMARYYAMLEGKEEVDGLSLDMFGTLRESAKEFDTDDDGLLGGANLNELTAFLQSHPAHQKVTVSTYYDAFTSIPRIELEGQPKQLMRGRKPEYGTLSITEPAFEIEFHTQRDFSFPSDVIKNYELLSYTSDEDKNGYLDTAEYLQLGLPLPFEQLDADGNAMLFKDEITTYLRRRSQRATLRPVFSVESRGGNIFEVLDSRRDGQLTARELRDSEDLFEQYDRNNDGVVQSQELVTSYRIEITFGEDDITRLLGDGNAATPAINVASNAQPRQMLGADVPAWFRFMDRNGDGEVTWNEFPAKRELFEQLDTNEDGLLSPEEAINSEEKVGRAVPDANDETTE